MLSCVRIVPERARQGSTQCLFITGEDFESEGSRVPRGEAEGGMDVDSRLRPTRRVAIRLMVVEKKTITSNYFGELYDSVNNFTDRLDVSEDTIL